MELSANVERSKYYAKRLIWAASNEMKDLQTVGKKV